MSIREWLKGNTHSLKGKTAAITGSTGGLGREICKYLALCGADLCLIDRNAERSQSLRTELLNEYPNISVRCIRADMEDIDGVKAAASALEGIGVDILILNAGAYAIPRHKCSTGYDNIFEINYVSPYVLTRLLLPSLQRREGHVVAVGSIAHRYSKTDRADVDFSARCGSAKAYGNSKRFLMFSLYELFEKTEGATLSVVHPGITFTNITAHYPKVIFAVIKHPMKVIFPSPRRAALCVIKGVFDRCEHSYWIGPKLFDIWGAPKKRKLRSVSCGESRWIGDTAEAIFEQII